MRLTAWISGLLLVAVTVVSAEREPPQELIIDTTYLPAHCPAKAQKGDSIQVHYVGVLSIAIGTATVQSTLIL